MTKTVLPFHFPGTIVICVIIFKGEDIGNVLPICICKALLNMYSEPFEVVLNVRACEHESKSFDRAIDP